VASVERIGRRRAAVFFLVVRPFRGGFDSAGLPRTVRSAGRARVGSGAGSSRWRYFGVGYWMPLRVGLRSSLFFDVRLCVLRGGRPRPAGAPPRLLRGCSN
jgi:hypothetical protein